MQANPEADGVSGGQENAASQSTAAPVLEIADSVEVTQSTEVSAAMENAASQASANAVIVIADSDEVSQVLVLVQVLLSWQLSLSILV